MDNCDWQAQHYREMADDDYFNGLAGKRRFKTQDQWEDYQQELIDNMDECEKCKAGLLDDDFRSCGEITCSSFVCGGLQTNECISNCDLKDECIIYKKAHKAEGE